MWAWENKSKFTSHPVAPLVQSKSDSCRIERMCMNLFRGIVQDSIYSLLHATLCIHIQQGLTFGSTKAPKVHALVRGKCLGNLHSLSVSGPIERFWCRLLRGGWILGFSQLPIPVADHWNECSTCLLSIWGWIKWIINEVEYWMFSHFAIFGSYSQWDRCDFAHWWLFKPLI